MTILLKTANTVQYSNSEIRTIIINNLQYRGLHGHVKERLLFETCGIHVLNHRKNTYSIKMFFSYFFYDAGKYIKMLLAIYNITSDSIFVIEVVNSAVTDKRDRN